MAILVDEHGTTSGIITLENVLEQVVGQIQDEFDQEEPGIVEVGKNRFEIAAGCPINDVQIRCGLELDEVNADTIGGIAIARLKHIPAAGESVDVGEHRITVLEASPAKIERVLLERDVTPNVNGSSSK